LVPFLDYDIEIRKAICSNKLDRIAKRPIPAHGTNPGTLPDRAGHPEMPVSYQPQPGPHRPGRTRWTMRWKPVINAFIITFSNRWPIAEGY
jgi:putative transposase